MSDPAGVVIGSSEPRDLTGTPAHEALRAHWQVPAGGYRRQPAANTEGDILANLDGAYRKRRDRLAAGIEARAKVAWDIYVDAAGTMTVEVAAKRAGLSHTTARAWWRKLGYTTR